MIPPPPSSPLFPYTTLFRSVGRHQTVIDLPGRFLVAGQPGDRSNRPRNEEKTIGVPPPRAGLERAGERGHHRDRKSTRLNSSHPSISYAVFCLKKKNKATTT